MFDQELTYPDHVGHDFWRWSSGPSCTVESMLDAASMAICGNDLSHRLRQEAKNSLAWLHTLTVCRWYTGGKGNDDRKKAFCTLLSHLLTECARVHHTQGSQAALEYAVGSLPLLFLPDLLASFKKGIKD